MQLPSKQFILIASATLGSIVIVAGAYFLASYTQTAPTTTLQNDQLTVTKGLLTDINEKDTDKDGLKDWQEALWGSDPKKPDTDSDGANDGDEIKANRNPLVKGPNDKLDIAAIQRGEGLPSDTASSTQTDVLARQLLIRYLALRQQGSLEDGQDAEIANSALASSLEPLSIKMYTTSDIKVGTDNSTEAMKAYGNAVAKIIKANTNSADSNEALIVQQAVATQDKKVLQKLDVIISNDTKIRDKIRALTVPPNLAQAHLNLINNLSELTATIEGMSKVLDDPLLAIIAVSNYNNKLQVFFTIFNELKITLKANKVIFIPTEDGYLFSQGV